MDLTRALQVLRDVAAKCPRAYSNAHANHNTHPERLDYIILAAQSLKRIDPKWGMNGKRGNASDPSADAIAYGVGRDVRIFDIITAAGEHGTNLDALGFNDVTAFGPGIYVDPDAWSPQAACSGDVPVPPPVPVPVPPPDAELHARIALMQTSLSFLINEVAAQRKDLVVAHHQLANIHDQLAHARLEIQDARKALDRPLNVELSHRYLGTMKGTIQP